MGHRGTNSAAVADDNDVVIVVPHREFLQRGANAVYHFSQRLTPRRSLMPEKWPKGVLGQREPCWQFGVRQALPFAKTLLDQARFHLQLGAWIAGREYRLCGSAGARQGRHLPCGGSRQARGQGLIHWLLLK